MKKAVFTKICAAALAAVMVVCTGCVPRKQAVKPVSSAVSKTVILPYPQRIQTQFDQRYAHASFQQRYEAAKKINSDTVGWLFVPGTTIDLPVTQYSDNKYYLKHGLNKQYKWKGNPFLDHRNTLEPMTRNLIVYGHNMGDGDLFGQLKNYRSLSYLKQHPVFYFSDGDTGYYWKIFAVFITDVNFYYIQTDFKNNADFASLLSKMQSRSFFKASFDVVPSDTILTFSTCTYEFKNARFVVVARKLRENQQESLFDGIDYTVNPNPVGPHGK